MNRSNLKSRSTFVEEPMVTATLDKQSPPIQTYEDKDQYDSNPYFSDISEQLPGREAEEDRHIPESRFISKVVSEGDTIFQLARDVYHIRINNSILSQIRQANPHILDLDHIEVGDRIFFPKLPISDIEKPLSYESYLNPMTSR